MFLPKLVYIVDTALDTVLEDVPVQPIIFQPGCISEKCPSETGSTTAPLNELVYPAVVTFTM
jgi:hypothetical protein